MITPRDVEAFKRLYVKRKRGEVLSDAESKQFEKLSRELKKLTSKDAK